MEYNVNEHNNFPEDREAPQTSSSNKLSDTILSTLIILLTLFSVFLSFYIISVKYL